MMWKSRSGRWRPGARVQLWSENEKGGAGAGARRWKRTNARSARRRALRRISGSYLRITAPFDGVITERNAQPGQSGQSPGGQADEPADAAGCSRFRACAWSCAVPEAEVASVKLARGSTSPFRRCRVKPSAAWCGGSSHALDAKTRTMPVELDVHNPIRRLAPGMFPEVIWPVASVRAHRSSSRPRPSPRPPSAPSSFASATGGRMG